MSKVTIQVTLAVEVDDGRWAIVYGQGDAYNEAEAQPRRSLVADVEDYIHHTIAESAAAQEGAITSVACAVDGTVQP